MPTDYIIDYLSDDHRTYRKALSSVKNIDQYDVDDLKILLTGGDTETELMSFFVYHIEKLNEQGRGRTARPFQIVYNSLVDFHSSKLFASSLTSKFFERFEHFLRTRHTILRSQGKVTITKENVSN